MAINRDEVKRIAQLARLEIAEEAVDQYAQDLSQILTFFEQLSQFDVTDVAPMAHPLEMKLRLRRDEVTETDQRELFQAIAPLAEKGLYLVPRVID